MNVSSLCFWRKQQDVVLSMEAAERTSATEFSMMYLDGFCCGRCRAALFDDRTDCFICKTPYSSRAEEVASWHREAKWRLVKKMSHDDAAHVLKEVTERLAANPRLSLKEASLSLNARE